MPSLIQFGLPTRVNEEERSVAADEYSFMGRTVESPTFEEREKEREGTLAEFYLLKSSSPTERLLI